MSENRLFNKALSDFMYDFAGGDEIRKLADDGFSVSQIKKELSFPISKDKIGQIMWEHFVKNGKICLEEPKESGVIRKTKIIREQGEFGKVSFRQVVEEVPAEDKKYVLCSFGKLLLSKKKNLLQITQELSEADRDYLQYLPWPPADVWHIEDERIIRINNTINSKL